MKVVLFTRYGRLGASSRVRMLMYTPALEAAGMELSFHPLFDDDYLERRYSGGSLATASLKAVLRRLADLRNMGDVDLLWIEKEMFPWLPFALEHRLLPSGVPYVLDFDDAVFHAYDMHRVAAVRYVLGRKFDHLMEGSAVVTAGNNYLAHRALASGANRVEIVPTVVDARAYQTADKTEVTPATIGWIGSPSTWHEYVGPMLPLLLETASFCGGKLMAVGGGPAVQPHPLLDQCEWSEADEVTLINKMDIGIMPLSDTPWARGKCGYKLIQYMAAGLPVVASPVGVNAEIVEDGVNGFLVSTEQEWRNALSVLLSDANLRRQMGQQGRLKVEKLYSVEYWAPRIVSVLMSAKK